jgi:hypothetical protein
MEIVWDLLLPPIDSLKMQAEASTETLVPIRLLLS